MWQSKNIRGKNHHNYKKQKVLCAQCGKPVYKPLYKIKRTINFFCNTKCMGEWNSKNKRGVNSPLFGGDHINWYGYKVALVSQKEKKTKYIAEHRIIAERALGKRLKRDEVVHHIDLDKTNNKNNNLLVCTHSYHRTIHHNMAQMYAEKFLRIT